MAGAGVGRDQLAPLERLVKLLSVLWAAGASGVSGERLLAVAAFGGDVEGQRRQLARTLRQLDDLGYDIRNTAVEGAPATYRLVARDNRLRVALTPPQQAELLRAAYVAGRSDLERWLGDAPAPGAAGGESDADADAVLVQERWRSPELDKVLHAAAHRCLVRFTYKERARVVHPHSVYSGASGWYLAGREDGGDADKVFVVARMRDVALDPPGSSEPLPGPHRRSLDPLSWQLDPPVEVLVETAPEHAPLVRAMLGAPSREDVADGIVSMAVPVTHRSAFRARLYELGPRVRLLGPPEVRAEVLAELAAAAGEPG